MSVAPGTPNESSSEQAFYDLWSQQLDPRSIAPTTLSERGGRLADRAAWVFVAGYQGALRQCFPDLRNHAGWASYLVSEARDDSKAPTCVLEVADGSRPAAAEGGAVLNGTKNWAAASAHLSWLVVNATWADSGSQESSLTANVLVPVGASGAELIAKPSGRFLPELEVGKARFDAVEISGEHVLADEDTHAQLFGVIEARCLLVALAGHFAQLAPLAPEPEQALLLAGGLVTRELHQKASIDVLLQSMDLLVDWFERWLADADTAESAALQSIRNRWSDDQRLLQMHRPMLVKRLEGTS